MERARGRTHGGEPNTLDAGAAIVALMPRIERAASTEVRRLATRAISAEDVAQATALRLLQASARAGPPRLDSRGAEGWVVVCARSAAVDALRRELRHRRAALDAWEAAQAGRGLWWPSAGPPGPTSMVALLDRARLTEQQAHVITLLALGQGYGEVACLLSTRPAVVQARALRAVSRLTTAVRVGALAAKAGFPRHAGTAGPPSA